MLQQSDDTFPLSQEKIINGTRRMAREKVLQILTAFYISDTAPEVLFNHIFTRQFNFGDDEEIIQKKLLKPQEVLELEADIPISWKKDDLEYAKKLVRLVLEESDSLDELLKEFSDNWDFSRINVIDKCLMRQTIIEILHFSDIPIKVSINEAIDAAKKYSTDRSSQFINGVLDTVLEKLKKEGKVFKTGRGLNENKKKLYS